MMQHRGPRPRVRRGRSGPEGPLRRTNQKGRRHRHPLRGAARRARDARDAFPDLDPGRAWVSDQEVALITDGRFSGATRGASIGHVSPGGRGRGAHRPRQERRPDLVRSRTRGSSGWRSPGAELRGRRAAWKPRPARTAIPGYLSRYAADGVIRRRRGRARRLRPASGTMEDHAMTGAEILIDALKKEGVDTDLRISRGGRPVHLRRPVQDARDQARPDPARAGGGPRRRRLRPGHGPDRRLPGHLRTGGDEHHHRAWPTPSSIPSPWSSSAARCGPTVLGSDAFQETDMAGLTRPICKHSYLVQKRRGPASGHPELLSYRPERAGPARWPWTFPSTSPWPAWIPTSIPRTPISLRISPPDRGSAGQIRKLASAIRKAERPVVLAGGGIVSAGACGRAVAVPGKDPYPRRRRRSWAWAAFPTATSSSWACPACTAASPPTTP